MTTLLSRLLPLAALFSAACGHAQTAPAPAPAPAAKPVPVPTPAVAGTDADPALWVVKDADTTIYLFGTIHILKPGLTWFDEAVKAAFDKSDELRLEMVLPPADEAQKVAMALGTTTTGPTLPERLPAAARTKYLATLTGMGIPPAAFDRFQPWFAGNNLTVFRLLGLGYKLDSGAEKVLTAAAQASGKPISGFETLNEQLGFFAGLSEPTQVAYLTGVLDELPKVAPTIEGMVGTWSKGDPVALAKLMNEDVDNTPELSKALLADRNARWATWIKARLAKPGSVFIAVGAGHLAGPDSVQAKLAAEGVKAERIAY